MIIPKLDLDNRYLNKVNKTAFYNRNVVLDKGRKAIVNEDGFSSSSYVDNPVIGIIDLPTGFVIFSTDNNMSEIGVYDGINYIKKLDTAYLGFKLDCPIEGVAKYNTKGELIVSWWNNIEDNSTSPKLLNLDDLPFPSGLTAYELTDPTEISLCNLSPDYTVPNFDITIGDGGQIAIGQYSFVIAYQLNKADTLNWVSATRFIPISNIKHDIGIYTADLYDYSDDSGLIVNKTINLHITNLDAKFPFFKLGVISKINGVVTFNEVGSYNINIGLTADIIFNGSTIPSNTTLAEVITPTRIFKKVKTGCINNRRLVFGNVEIRDSLDYQKYANNIKVDWTTSQINGADGDNYYFKKGEAVFYLRNFKPDEVEALYFYFTFKDGSISEAFHIPGRQYRLFTLPSTAVVNETGQIPYDGTSRCGDGVNLDTRYFHIFDTSTVDGVDGGGLPYGTMSYWMNLNEYYPDTDDFDVWGIYNATLPNVNPLLAGQYINFSTLPLIGGLPDSNYVSTLRNTNVRHHKFPSVITLVDNSPTLDVDLVLGIKLSNIAIPTDILNEVQSINLAFAKRGLTDSTVIGDSLLSSETLNYFGSSNSRNYGFYDFDLLCSKPAIAPIYVKRNYIVTAVTFAKTTYPPTTDIHDQVDVIDSYEYIPADISGYNILNDHLRLIPKFPNAPGYPILDTNNYSELAGDWSVGTLHQFLEDVFLSFYEQTLIPLGYNFDAATIAGTHTVELEPTGVYRIHGGDCFLSKRSLYIEWRDPVNPNLIFQPQIVTYQYANYQYRSLPSTGTWGLLNDNEINYDWYALMEYFAPSCYNPYSVSNYKFPYTIFRSIVEPTDGITENWRTFLANDKYEMYKYKGEIWGLATVNRTLCINQKYSFYVAKLKDTLETPSGADAYLGEGDIFDRQPMELLSTNEGYAGCQSQFARFVYPGGYVFIDRQQGKVFLFDGSDLNEISAIGLREYFTNTLNTRYDIDNPFALFGLTATYNDIDKILIVSKRDITLGTGLYWYGKYDPNFAYGVGAVYTLNGKVYYIPVSTTPTLLNSSQYTLNYFTLSYSTTEKYWVSWHDYYPNYVFYNRIGTFSILNLPILNSTSNTIHKHNAINNKGGYFNSSRTPYSCYIDVIFNDYPTISKLIETIFWQTDVLVNDVNKWNLTFTHIVVYNDTQCSDIIELNKDGEWFDAMTGRTIHDSWYFNNFRDCTLVNTKQQLSNNDITVVITAPSNISGKFLPLNSTHPDVVATPTLKNVDKLMKEYFDLSNFISKFVVVRLIYDNRQVSGQQADIFINDVDVEVNKSSI